MLWLFTGLLHIITLRVLDILHPTKGVLIEGGKLGLRERWINLDITLHLQNEVAQVCIVWDSLDVALDVLVLGLHIVHEPIIGMS